MGKRRLSTVQNSTSMNNFQLGSEKNIHLAETDLFSTIPFQNSILQSYWSVCYPEVGSLLDSNPALTFNLGQSQHLTDLADSFIRLEIGFKKEKPHNNCFHVVNLKKKNFSLIFNFYGWVKFCMLASQTGLTDNPFFLIQLSVLIAEVWLIFKRHMHHMRFRKWLFKIDWSIQERWVELSSSVKTNNDSAIIELMEQSRLSS